jgi:hypothetical protein
MLGHSIQLGHYGWPCPEAKEAVRMIITHTNGIHATSITFCGENGKVDRVEQLMAARLFPSTWKNPTSAFTYQVLKEFQIHSLEGKGAAYDYLGSLRRLTDNSFTASVPVSRSSQ